MGASCDKEGLWLVNCTACVHHLLLGFSHSATNLAVPMGLGFEAAPKLQDFEMVLEFKKIRAEGHSRLVA